MRPTEWDESDIEYLVDRYWDDTYVEIAEELGMSQSVVHRKAKNDLGLPKKTEYSRVEYEHGVPLERVLYHLHHDALMSVNEMSDALGVARKTLDRWFEKEGVYKRNASEAERVKWEKMTPEEREERIKSFSEEFHDTMIGTETLRRWQEENPEEALRHAREAAALGAAGREKNGMAGVTGQDSPAWRGGKSVYDAVKKQLHGPSWGRRREESKRRDGYVCQNCGTFGKWLDTHHIVPIMAGGTNGLWNLMPLCRDCHGKAEAFIRGMPEFDPVLVE